VSNPNEKCKIFNEYCLCQLNENKNILKFDSIEKTNQDFLQNSTQIKENLNFTGMIAFVIRNKLIKNISNSNVRHLLSVNLKSLSIKDCKLKKIERGIFNFMLQLKNILLSRNEIESIENDSFLTEPYESNTLELHLSENKLIKIKRGYFNGLFRLQILYLDKNQIEEIEENSFVNLNQLKELKIESNKVKIIKNEMFFGKSELEILYLYQNYIENIESIPFNTLRSLKKLYLFSNKITNIKFGHFIHLQNLDELRLDKNEIGSFDPNTFIGLEKLVNLTLSANKVQKIVDGAFHGLINLTNLDLHLNDINQIGTNVFTDLTNLNFLNLDSNQISTLKNVQFNSKLEKLSIRFNMMTNLNEINLASLQYLIISNNRIQEIKLITLLSNLEYLDLSQNRLISIKKESFKNLNKLKYLNLSYNKLDLQSEFNNISFFQGQSLLEILDLSFNEIKYLDKNLTFQNLTSLKFLSLFKNKLKNLNPFIFGFLVNLDELNLGSNSLNSLNWTCFFSLKSLKKLKLNSNQINSSDFLKSSKIFLYNLEFLDLEGNNISFIEETHFQSYRKLSFLNLNSNPIKTVPEKVFNGLFLLKTLKLSNTSILTLSLLSTLEELDISFLNATISNVDQINALEWINLANSSLNCSLKHFIRNSSKYVDFSFKKLDWEVDFKIFKFLGSALETLKLSKTNLQNIDQINLKNLINLKYLDLSFNNLSFLSQDSFEYTLNLEYLDLSSNALYEFTIVLNKLKYLNLDNNQINSTNEILNDYYSIEIFKMANNRLKTYPSFELSRVNIQNNETFLELDLSQNEIKEIRYFSFIFGKLILANFDTNNISLIERDAFLNCRSLEFLSIADNRLTNLTENNFHFLFSLIQLNLSFNEISFIEKNAFLNLNKLKSLDLNYNKLVSIENDLFNGLINLNNLHLLSRNEMTFYNQSFHFLSNISTLVLNESLISKYKCLFILNLERFIQRNVSNKYIFYKSVNLLTLDFSFRENPYVKCDLTLQLFQFKIHFNLKTDHRNDLFYESCQEILIKKENNFNYTKRKCFENFNFNAKEEYNELESVNLIFKVFSNFYYLLSMALILSILIPSFYMIFRYQLLFNLFPKVTCESSRNSESLARELEKEMKRNDKKLEKINLGYLRLDTEKQKIEEDLLMMQKTYKELEFIRKRFYQIAN
jgi:insulin-like growth factor-binding protein complex acid labile subunit